MKNLYHKENYPPQFNNVPRNFRFYLNEFNHFGSIPDDVLQQIETALLKAINSQEISSGYSPVFPDRRYCNKDELIVWLGANFSIYIKQQEDESFSIINPTFDDTIDATEGIRLICFDDAKRYDLVWSDQVENYINNCKDKINISIIEDYKEILSLISDFNKEALQKIGHLPYLGETKDNGDCFLLDRKIYRPEYERIKTDPTISIENCICVLLGIDDIDLFDSVGYELYQIKDHKMGIMDVDPEMQRLRNYTKVPGPYNDFVVMNYEKGWHDIFLFVNRFISKICGKSGPGIININDGCQIDYSKEYDLTDLSPFVQNLENCKFKTFGFLSWMQENRYPIPEELAIEKNGHGEMVWAGHSSKTKQITTIPVSSETKWHQIHFRIVNPTRIEITTPDGMEPYHPDDLGFTQRIWDLFERIAADGAEYIRGVDKKEISDLRILLRKAVPMLKDSDPIPFVRKKGWRAEFHITEA